ncbi:hypothetical protein [Pseudomonas sp. DSP3-2-2]|uniref:hypothetical protein n=1 Tax=unclassified Pseudomonas TaxID=196821 RepID=UPI003CEFF2E4
MTTSARPIFTVKKHKDGKVWICIEEGPVKSPLTNGTYGFELGPQTSREKAEEVAKYMGENLQYFVKH